MANKYIIGTLILVILTSSVYVLMPDNVRVDIGKTYSTFKVYENGSWVLSGVEYVNLFDGPAKMRAKSRDLNYVLDGNATTITRTAYYKNNITTIEKYYFDGSRDDVEFVPVKHSIQVLNAVREGPEYILQYEVQKLLYTGETISNVESPQSFGHKMKVEWEDGNYYSKIYKYKDKDEGKITIKYRIDSNDFNKDVRLYDPEWPSSLNTGLVAYYKLNESTGTTVQDSHTSNHDGTYHNNLPNQTTGLATNLPYAQIFDNTAFDYISVPENSAFAITGDLAINMWINDTDLSQIRLLFDKSGSGESEANNTIYAAYVGTGGTITFMQENGAGVNDFVTTSGSYISANEKIMLTIMRDATANEWKLYKNGTNVENVSYANDPTGGTTGLFYIGVALANLNDADRHFKGIIGDVGLWNRTITGTEISALWNSSNGITYIPEAESQAPNSPVLNYPLNDSSDIPTSPLLNVTVSDPEGDLMNVSFYNVSEQVASTEDIFDLSMSFPSGAEDSGGTYDTEHDVFLIIGGDHGNGTRSESIYSYNKSTNNYTDLGDLVLNDVRFASESCVYAEANKTHWCYGGHDGSKSHAKNFWYNYNTNTSGNGISLPVNLTANMVNHIPRLNSNIIMGGINYNPEPDLFYRQIWLHNLTSNTITNPGNLTTYLAQTGSFYDRTNDWIIMPGGSHTPDGNRDNVAYWNNTIKIYVNNWTSVTLQDSSDFPYTGADSMTCEWMPDTGDGYCFGSVASSYFAPYTYRDDIVRWNAGNETWQITSQVLLDDIEDQPCVLDYSVNDTIYCFRVLQAGSTDNDITKMTETQKFNLTDVTSDVFILIGTNNSVTNNSYATLTWSGLSESTTYEWFVSVTDNNSKTTNSSVWNFTTVAPGIVKCLFSGYVKDENSNLLVGAVINIWNQLNISESYSNTTNSNGYWSYNLTNSTKTYMVGAYYNSTLIGQLKPYISGTC